MKLRIYLLALLLGALGFAGCEAAEQNASGTALPVSAEAPSEKTIAASEEKAAKEEVAEVPLLPIDASPLTRDDFMLHGMTLGDRAASLIQKMGVPDAISRGSVSDTYTWKDFTARVNHAITEESAWKVMGKTAPPTGLTEYRSERKDLKTLRGIHVGSSREAVLRAYGRPLRLLWDGEKKDFLLIYEAENQEISFTIHKNVVKSLHVSYRPEKKLGVAKVQEGHDFLPKEDFSLAGLSLGRRFKDYSFMEWERKMMNPGEEIWYYEGYGVRMTKKEHWIIAFFLTDDRMLTPRGLALGDDQSTAEMLYGAPHKLELDTSTGSPRTAYVYFSQGQKEVLILYFKNKKVDGIVCAGNPQRGK